MQKAKEEKPREWLVTPPENKSLKQALIEACRGNEKHAELLNYFIFSAQCEAEAQKLDLKTIESVTLGKRDQDSILRSLAKHKDVKTTKKTLIEWIKRLEDYGFIKADGRRHTYHVYINPIRDAIKEPPAREPGKPRGKNVNSPSSKNVNSSLKSLIQAQINDFSGASINDLEETTINLFEARINELQLTINDLEQKLQFAINDFSEKVNSLIVDRDAWRAAAEGKIEALYIKLSNTETITHITKEGKTASASFAPSSANEETTSKIVSLQDKQAKRSRTSKQKETPAQEEVVFTAEEQALYDLYCTLWYVANPPAKSEKVKTQCGKLAPHVKTPEDMQSLDKYAREHTPGKPRSLYLGNLVAQLNGWIQERKPAPATSSKQSTQTTLFDQPAESSAPEPEQKDAGPDLVYWTLDGDHKSRNYLTWGWMPFEEAQKLGMKFRQLQPVPIQRDTFQSKKATACKNLGLLDEYLKLSKDEKERPLVDWVKQFQTTTVTA